ncbi:MAG: alkaline phosphatase family protein, partial [Sulfuritalea sp.]|nr:alkaline phosphatase family protein [Sulfuritalea sp.]
FTYAYWPCFDNAAHDGGIAGQQALDAFRQIEQGLEEFLESTRGTDTMVVLTADHGFVRKLSAGQSTPGPSRGSP